jgi:nitrate/nitrite-specific signal transduction histidine kinase
VSDRLDSAVRAYVDSLYGDAAAPDLRVEVADGLTLAWTTEAIVLRVVQEAIGNVCRHAGARHIEVTLGTDEDLQLTLSVSDDGCGFDPAVVVHERGIAVMRSFASLVDATLTIDSRPGAGTTVWLREQAGSESAPGSGSGCAPGSGPGPGRPHLRLVRPDGSGAPD